MTEHEHAYCVYIVASRSHTLYCGVTNSIRRRMDEHRSGTLAGFSATYKCNRLVSFERFQYVGNAIAREKQIKGWVRQKKVRLIEAQNPTWADLSGPWRIGNDLIQLGSSASLVKPENAGPSASLRMTSCQNVSSREDDILILRLQAETTEST